ncbi:PQQ-dependent sugar dehydrogenase [Novilysobacter antarcticus]|uniref:PQQ-dependent sugar dehydrogenase n=1 Tax=Novilysobacter antarcticus TaxID=2862543 RepID=UPI001C997C8E|nr:PQQ-dependent sugar dehydrogenase [Lysobacter antarcticus]
MRNSLPTILAMALLVACSPGNGAPTATAPADAGAQGPQAAEQPFVVTEIARFREPWAMSFLPDGQHLLVTQKGGQLKLVGMDGKSADITGVPEVVYGGQGGLGDVVLHPDFSRNQLVYLSYAEGGERDTRGAAVARARLVTDAKGGGKLTGLEVLWRQVPKVQGEGHYGHRIAFGPDGHLWISSGERQKFDPAQDMASNLGKVLRLNDDGTIPADNPFSGEGKVASQVWSLGHRNPLGLAFNASGELWEIEMGPKGGDELNLIERGANYGYPIVSNGDHYDGRPIPDHDTQPQFKAPAISWTPVISPSSLIFYSGEQFPAWKGNAFASGLSSRSLVRIAFDGDSAREAERFDMGERIRAVAQGPDGDLYLLEDGPKGRLLRLAPPAQTD